MTCLQKVLENGSSSFNFREKTWWYNRLCFRFRKYPTFFTFCIEWVKHMQVCLENMSNFPQFTILSLSYLLLTSLTLNGKVKWQIRPCQWVCRVCGTQHRLQGELSGSWNAHVFFCLLGITSSKAALGQSSRAWLYFCRALAVCRWISAFFSQWTV